MASTYTLQNSINWAAPFLRYQPQVALGGTSTLEPALSSANMILQTMLGPPFAWRWNRKTLTVVTGAAQQDNTALATDFGYMEKVAFLGAAGDPPFELTIRDVLADDGGAARPQFVSLQIDANDAPGTLTFRTQPVFANGSNLRVIYQKKAAAIATLASTWAPLPDELSYIYNWGFLAMQSLLTEDERFPIFEQKFISHLLGAQEGMDETQRNIFLGNWFAVTKAAERAQLKTQQGIQARTQ